jgi:hypothetical protein
MFKWGKSNLIVLSSVAFFLIGEEHHISGKIVLQAISISIGDMKAF